MPLDPNPVKDILYRTTARYASVRHYGIQIGRQTLTTLKARILAHGPARTLYRGRKPFCRSLDAIRSTDGKRCADCHELKNCTSQLRIHLLIDQRPYCLLLAYTSAKNFLLFQGALASQGGDVRDIAAEISVVDRGTWGELRFKAAERRSSPAD